MGRKPKYATLSVYQPYIDIMCDDLALPSLDKLNVQVVFNHQHVYRTGSAVYYPTTNYGELYVYKKGSKTETLKTLAHELKHIQQFYYRRLVYHNTKIGNKKYNVLFDGIPGKIYKGGLTNKQYNEYKNSPWEVEARAYEEQAITRLFPYGDLPMLPIRRFYIGTIGTTDFYKLNPERL